MIDVVKIVRPDTCPVCGRQRSLELYDRYGNTMNYTYMVTLYMSGNDLYKDYLDGKRAIKYMKCRSCGEEIVVNWYNEFPHPLRYQEPLRLFMNRYYNQRD